MDVGFLLLWISTKEQVRAELSYKVVAAICIPAGNEGEFLVFHRLARTGRCQRCRFVPFCWVSSGPSLLPLAYPKQR